MKPADIRSFRRRYHFTQQELADALEDLPKARLQSVEQGRAILTADQGSDLKGFISFVTRCSETGRL